MNAGGLGFHRRLGVRLGVAMALLTALAFVSIGTFVAGRERDTLTREFTLRLRAESRSLAVAAETPLLRLDPELELHPLVTRALSETPDLVDLVVLDAREHIQGHRDLNRVGTPYERDAAFVGGTPGLDGEIVSVGPHAIRIEQPIRHLGQPIGLLVALASSASIEQEVHAAQRNLAWIGCAATLLVIVTALALVRLHLQPLGELRRGVRALGSGDLATRVRVTARNELGLFSDLLNSMAEGLQKAQVSLVQKERLDRELEIAHDLQAMLLPSRPAIPARYELESSYEPALEVSGDYFDVLRLDDHQIVLVTADVSGKGVPGLVVMSIVRTVIHALAQPGMDPGRVLLAINTMLHGSIQRGMFVTCLVGVLDTRDDTFRYVSAGHCPPVHFGPHGTRYLEAGGKPLGIFPDALAARSLTERQVTLAAGDGLLLYTDGLVEAFDAAGQALGMEAVLADLQKARGGGAADVLASLLRRARTHRGEAAASDDLTLIVLRRTDAAVMPAVGTRA